VSVEQTVKQVAVRVGLPERTVRYYARIGLVSPQARSTAGYRLYGPEEVGKLQFVRQAKALGFSLEEIRGLIAAAERGCCGQVVPELHRLLDEKVAEIDARIAELGAFRERLVAYRVGRAAACGCQGHGPFCCCLDAAPLPEDIS
jgi:DNA-binding transcriptional MerR regulator